MWTPRQTRPRQLSKAAGSTASATADFIKAWSLRPHLGLPGEIIGTAVFPDSDASEFVTANGNIGNGRIAFNVDDTMAF